MRTLSLGLLLQTGQAAKASNTLSNLIGLLIALELACIDKLALVNRTRVASNGDKSNDKIEREDPKVSMLN